MSAYVAPSVENITHILFNKQGGKCYYCKQLMLPFNVDDHSSQLSRMRTQLSLYPTFEHAKVLKMHGGLKTVENGVCACKQCNNLKGIINHAAFEQIVTCIEDQQLLISQPPLPLVIPTLRKFTTTFLQYLVHRTKAMKRALPKKSIQQTVKKGNNYVYNYTVKNITKIKAGMLSQRGKCCMCEGDLVGPHTVNKKCYMTSDLRPILVKNTTSVVCYGCGSTIKSKTILAKLNVAF